MTSTSRRYYERELGAGMGPSPAFDEAFGYSEPLRRFIQREGFEPQANEIPNTMPSWMPGDDYYTNFRVGDPYIKIDQGFARLPGTGYEAIHPELDGVDPEDYPDINKLAILADVAPYSREYNTYRLKVGKQAQDNTEFQIEYETRAFFSSGLFATFPIHYEKRAHCRIYISPEQPLPCPLLLASPSLCCPVPGCSLPLSP